MAENGLFRVGFRGFDKEDVLKYIEQMKLDSAKRFAEVDRRRKEAEDVVADATAKAADAIERCEQAEQKTVELQEQVDKLTALAKIYKTELLSLREKVEAHEDEDVKTAAQEMNARKIAELEQKNMLLAEQNARYAKIVGDVNRLVVEARVISGSHFDAAHQKSSECLHLLETFLDELKEQTREAVQNADDRRREGDAYIETLLSDLKDLGAVNG